MFRWPYPHFLKRRAIFSVAKSYKLSVLTALMEVKTQTQGGMKFDLSDKKNDK